MVNLEVNEGKKNPPTSMPTRDPIIGMNLNSSQMELVQSWGLGHSGRPQLIFPSKLDFLEFI